MKYILTPSATISLEQITEFLKQRWTHKELAVLKDDIRKFKKNINEKIIKHPNLENFPNIKYTFVGKKQVKLFYEKKIRLLSNFSGIVNKIQKRSKIF